MYVDISKIDTNFLAGSNIEKEDITWINILETPISIHGLAVTEPGKFWRLPEYMIDRVNGGVTVLAKHTTGGRIRFRTDSPYIAYRAKQLFHSHLRHMPLTGSAGTDIFVNGKSFTTFSPNQDSDEWFEGILEIGADWPNMQGMKDIELNMGLYNGITEGWIGLKAGSRLEAAKPYAIEKPIVYYGNSVTQGGCASKPGNSFPGFLGRWLDADHINLGFSGSGLGEESIAEYIASLDMSMLFMDYDCNAPTVEYLRDTHYRFYQIVREKNPDLPILMASKPNGDQRPTICARCREVIWETYNRAIAEGDRNVDFIDGMTLFDKEHRDSCTMDGAHPNDLGFFFMAQGILPYIKKALG